VSPLSHVPPSASLETLRRRIAALVALALITTLVAGAVYILFERERRAVSTRVTDFHNPTLVAVQEALLALSELRLDAAPPASGDAGEWLRLQRRRLNELEQHLRTVRDLQRAYRWPEAASTVAQIERHLADIGKSLSAPPAPAFAVPATTLDLRLDQLRLLHQDEQVTLLRRQTARDDTFSSVVAPLLAALVAVGAAFTWLVWRRIGQSLATEEGLRGSLVNEISERRQVEAELLLKEAAIATSINGIVITNAEGTLVYANPAFRSMWRIREAQPLASVSVRDLWRADTADGGDGIRLPETGWSGEVVARRADGTEFPALLSYTAVRDERGVVTHTMASFVDVTEARAAQAQLIQSQKLESVGRLAGGVAHDFNNLLLVIKGYVEMAQAEVPQDHVLGHHLAEVARAADSAAALTAQMLTFSRRQIIAPVVLDLNGVITHVRGMLARMLGEDIGVRVVLAADLWRVRFDQGQAEQILFNLAVNARDAMPSGGTLMIETANATLDNGYADEHPDVAAGDYVVLTVSDTGLGMSSETREHAFEPFYTTKLPGAGTGLGLAIIHGAVSQNGGRIELYSEVGHGTTFKIYLPRTSDADRQPAEPPDIGRPRGHEAILLVEDDQAVRTLARRLLERQGYCVHEFAEPAAAIDWLRTGEAPIDLLFTDVIMPGMNGKELAAHVQTLRPGTKVLFVSGYTANVIVLHGVLKPGTEFLAKPYTQQAVAAKVREVLDKAP
jgi:PAS domain S-box-containing protein